MTEVTARCPVDGKVEVPDRDVWVLELDSPRVAFRCPGGCRDIVQIRANDVQVTVLRPFVRVVSRPAELDDADRRSTRPPLTLDDLIDLHEQLAARAPLGPEG